jgi:quinol monooxygenase YgiN
VRVGGSGDLLEDPASTGADPVAVVATVWRSAAEVDAHHRSALFREYRQAVTPLVRGLETVATSSLPASWLGHLEQA